MKITYISFRRTVNLGNYQSKTLEVGGELHPDEIPQYAIEELEDFVLEQLGVSPVNRTKKKEEEKQVNTNTEAEELDSIPF